MELAVARSACGLMAPDLAVRSFCYEILRKTTDVSIYTSTLYRKFVACLRRQNGSLPRREDPAGHVN